MGAFDSCSIRISSGLTNWKGLPRINTLAYFTAKMVTKKKRFIRLGMNEVKLVGENLGRV